MGTPAVQPQAAARSKAALTEETTSMIYLTRLQLFLTVLATAFFSSAIGFALGRWL